MTLQITLINLCIKSFPALFGAQFDPQYFEKCSLGVVVVSSIMQWLFEFIENSKFYIYL